MARALPHILTRDMSGVLIGLKQKHLGESQTVMRGVRFQLEE